MKIEAVDLQGRHVRLEPLCERHCAQLAEASQADELWRWMPMKLQSEEAVRGWVAIGDGWLAAGSGLLFATIDSESNRVTGSTGFLNASPGDRRVEIGATWVEPSFQRTATNTEAKLLMMQHAFETWGCGRVEFKTDAQNQKSRAALERIGAREEGVLRAHMVMPDGRVRDSVYFSVLASEWPAVRAALEQRLGEG